MKRKIGKFKIILALLLVFSMISSNISATDINYNFNYVNNSTGNYLKNSITEGNTKNYNYSNGNTEATFDDEGYVNYDDKVYLKKSVKEESEQGLFEITLDVKGNQFPNATPPVDVVILLDTSSTMKGDRLEKAKTALRAFFNSLGSSLDADKVNIAFVAYDKNATNISNGFSYDKDFLISSLDNVSTSSGTFIQKGLLLSQDLLFNSGRSNAYKALIHIGDGSAHQVYPTQASATSYPANGKIVSNGSYSMDSYYTDYDTTSSDIIERGSGGLSDAEADKLTAEYTIGMDIGIRELAHNGVKNITSLSIAVDPSTRGEFVAKNLASNQDLYKKIEDISELEDALIDFANNFTTNTVIDGIMNDPLSDYALLQKDLIYDNKYYELKTYSKTSGNWNENTDLLDGVKVSYSQGKFEVDRINLGINEKITLKYKIRINTEDSNFVPEKWYLTNKRTTMDRLDDGSLDDFPIPSIKAAGVKLDVIKEWDDKNDREKLRPNNISYVVNRKDITANTWKSTDKQKLSGKNSIWSKTINNATSNNKTVYFPKFNNKGVDFKYTVKEVNVDNNYVVTYKDGKIINTLNVAKVPPTGSNNIINILMLLTLGGSIILYRRKSII